MADVYGGENDITSFRQIYRGEIGPVMVLSSTDTIAIAVAVWGDTDTYSAGEKGKVLADTEADTEANTDITQAKVDTL